MGKSKKIELLGFFLYGVLALCWTNIASAQVFIPVEIEADSRFSQNIKLGDLDGDGDLDAFVGNGRFNSGDSRVWFNDGSGLFRDSGQKLGQNDSISVALGDIDGDGDLDAFVVNELGADLRIWLNDGSGQFSDSGQMFITGRTNRAKWIELGDLDGDGDLDAFVGVEERNPNLVFINDGFGQFSDSGQSLGSGRTRSLKLGDIDGDGDLDAFVINSGGAASRIWLNNGNGQFSDSGMTLPLISPSSRSFVALGDIDGDGDLDAFLGNAGDIRDNLVWFNDGSGQFSDSGQTLGSSNSNSVFLADIDEDGDIDAFVGNGTNIDRQEANHIWLNDGDGLFVDSGQALGASWTMSVALGDLDGDGDLDAFVGNEKPNLIWSNEGNGLYKDSGQALGASSSRSVVLGDVDGDGDLDAFVANSDFDLGEPNRVWLNEGNGQYVDSGQSLGNSLSFRVDLGDLDGDGDLDAFVANTGFENNSNRIWINNGSGKFSDSGQRLGVNRSESIILGDVDSDGDLDAFVGNRGGPNRLWLNAGNAQFSESSQTFNFNDALIVAFGDVDGDGDLDAIEINNFNINHILLNDGFGQFSESVNTLGEDAISLVLGDVDGDGDLDAFVSNHVGNLLWLNDGNGKFEDSGQILGSDRSLSVALGDVDGDGDLDAFVGNINNSNRVWLNSGSGQFTDSGMRLGDGYSASVSLGDIDGDGDIDAFVGSFRANRIWQNITPPKFLSTLTAETLAGVNFSFAPEIEINGGTLTLTATELPQWLNFDSETGTISGTPSEADMGEHQVVLQASDSFQSTQESFTITVTENMAPVFTSTPLVSIQEGSAYQYQVTVTDDGVNSISATTLPDWLSFDAGTGLLSGTPGLGDAGSHSIVITSTDELQTVEQSFSLTVTENMAPVFTSTPLASIQEGSAYQYQVTITDDGVNSVNAITLPDWLSFDAGTGLLSGTPASADVGTHNIVINTTDELQTVEQSFSITVTALPAPPPPVSSSGGGGSFGYGFILGLFLLARKRRRFFES